MSMCMDCRWWRQRPGFAAYEGHKGDCIHDDHKGKRSGLAHGCKDYEDERTTGEHAPRVTKGE